jgi:hypothetical protein
MIEAADILPLLFSPVLIPAAVKSELLHPKAPAAVRDWVAGSPSWLSVVPPGSYFVPQIPKLGAGECELPKPRPRFKKRTWGTRLIRAVGNHNTNLPYNPVPRGPECAYPRKKISSPYSTIPTHGDRCNPIRRRNTPPRKG